MGDSVQTFKWFDLSRFGIALKVLPESPLRGVAMTAIEFHDEKLFQSGHGWPDVDSAISNDQYLTEVAEARRKIYSAFEALGFNPHNVSHVRKEPDLDADESVGRWVGRIFSQKLDYSLSELKTIAPDLDANDLREMPRKDVVIEVASLDAEITEAWKNFANNVLAKDAAGVWTPKVNPYDKPLAEAGLISQINPGFQALGSQAHPLVMSNSICSGQAESILDKSLYKSNAMIPYYPDRESAVADGHDDVHQVDLPYAMPLYVSKENKIIALKDVRFAPELMEHDPEYYYGSKCKDGLIVSALREQKRIEPIVSAEADRWRKWGDDPNSLDGPDLLWGSITHVVSTVEEFRKKYPRLVRVSSYDLTDQKEDSRNGTIRAKPLAEMDIRDARSLANIAGAINPAPQSQQEKVSLIDQISIAMECARDLMADHVKAVAQQKLKELTETVKAVSGSESPTPKESVKHVDAGEKIGGARKDFAKRAMVIEDLEQMNDLERKSLVVKNNIWPPLNYAQMKEDGVEAKAALAIKLVKDTLATQPAKRWGTPSTSVKDDETYIKAIAVVRDQMSAVKTLNDFNKALYQTFLKGAEIELEPGQRLTDLRGGVVLDGEELQVQWGRKAAHLISDGRHFERSEDYEYQTPYKVRTQISRKIERPYGKDASDDIQWGALIKGKSTKSEAELEEQKEKKRLDQELHRPHLAKVEREGPDWRGGRDIVADDLLNHFGFRAVEFGNWLPQDERQTVLNHAFDALADLAHALEIPPKGVSLGGELAIAFGSRGTGGKGAAMAHFEPERFVMNLTRLNGAGSLAHEWMHAFDFHLGNRVAFESEKPPHDRGEAMTKITSRFALKPGTPESIEETAMAMAHRSLDYTLSWYSGLRSQPAEIFEKVKSAAEDAFAEAHARIYESAAERIKLLKHKPDTVFNDRGAASTSVYSDASEAVGVQITKSFNQIEGIDTKLPAKNRNAIETNLYWLGTYLGTAATVQAARDLDYTLPQSFLMGKNAVESDFVAQAKKLDESRSKAYWSTTLEMFARAGAAFVFDELEAKGVQSDYLVYGADEARHINNPLGNPNPTGEDRQALNERFRDLVAEYRLKLVSSFDDDSSPSP